ncbi:MAG: TraR/DksA family transcriptional regulator [Burkholderiales bacterium]
MPLTDSQRSELESLIKRRRNDLAREIESNVARTRDNSFDAVAGEAPDAGDEALASLVADTENAEARRDLRELRELDGALTGLAEGTYGICDACGDDIPFERLRVNPGAMRCVRCQSMYEKTHNHPSEPSL